MEKKILIADPDPSDALVRKSVRESLGDVRIKSWHIENFGAQVRLGREVAVVIDYEPKK